MQLQGLMSSICGLSDDAEHWGLCLTLIANNSQPQEVPDNVSWNKQWVFYMYWIDHINKGLA